MSQQKEEKKVEQEEPKDKAKEEEQQRKEQQATGGWNDWSKASFGGDQAQKEKFMRLLGANKNKAAASADKPKKTGGLYGSLKSAIDEDEGARIANDLEKQFQSGLQFRKQMFSGRRGGLGST